MASVSSILLPYRLAGLPCRVTEKPYVQGVERVLYFLWDQVGSTTSSSNCSSSSSCNQYHHQHSSSSFQKHQMPYCSQPKCQEIYTDLSHHFQSVGVDEVVRWMTRVSEQEVMFRRAEHEDHHDMNSKYPLLRFATWTAYENLSDIPLHYEDSSRERIPLGQVAKTRILTSPPTKNNNVLQVECLVNGGGVGGPEFVKRQLSQYCRLLLGESDGEEEEEDDDDDKAEGRATCSSLLPETKQVMEFVLPNDASSIAEQLAILDARHNELEQQIETYHGNTQMVLNHAQELAEKLSPDQAVRIVNENRAAMEQELEIREKIAALWGDANSIAMVDQYKQQMEQVLTMTELEKVEQGLEKLEQGRAKGLDTLQLVIDRVRQKVVGTFQDTAVVATRTSTRDELFESNWNTMNAQKVHA